MTAEERLGEIANAHVKWVGDGGLTNGDCIECGHAWPCPTYVWATTDRDYLLDPWDPNDDEAATSDD
jgi:hypothetical protein